MQCSQQYIQLTAALVTDAHTDRASAWYRCTADITVSSSLPVQGGDGEWSVRRVLKEDTLSNNARYQDMLREGRRKSLPVAGRSLEQDIQHVQEKVSMSHSGEQ